MKIIGVAGRKYAGKDTFADPLIRQGWLLMKFADPLKNMLRALLATAGVSNIEAYIEGDRKEEPIPALCGRTMRYSMQTLGTEWGRQEMSYSFWTQIMRERLKVAAGTDAKGVVITDVRFPNEVATIKLLDGLVVRLNRSTGPQNIFSGHPSETLVDELKVHIDLDNDQSIAALHDSALRIARTLGQSKY